MVEAKAATRADQNGRGSALSLIKSIGRRIASRRIVGIPASYLLKGIGATRLGRRVSDLCGYVPRIVPIVIDGGNHRRKFWMNRGEQGQMDQGSATVWLRGWKGFERPLPDLFAACAEDAQVIFDIGANAGFYSLVAATVSKSAIIHAFEPFPVAQERMKANLKLNGMEQRIRICTKALSDQGGTSKLFVPAKAHTLLETSCSLSADFRSEHSDVLDVQVATLDQYVDENGLKRLDLIKLDVESQEHRVLAGAAKALGTLRPVILLEVLLAADHSALEEARRRHEYCSIQMKPDALLAVERVEFNQAAKNQILCPREKVKELAEKARGLGIALRGVGGGDDLGAGA